jgi:hypothetical protein
MVNVWTHVTHHKLASIIAQEALVVMTHNAAFFGVGIDNLHRGVAFDGSYSARRAAVGKGTARIRFRSAFIVGVHMNDVCWLIFCTNGPTTGSRNLIVDGQRMGLSGFSVGVISATRVVEIINVEYFCL